VYFFVESWLRYLLCKQFVTFIGQSFDTSMKKMSAIILTSMLLFSCAVLAQQTQSDSFANLLAKAKEDTGKSVAAI